MNEMKLATWRFPLGQMPPDTHSAAMLNIDMASHPELLGHLADWTAVSHTLTQTYDGDMLLSVLLTRCVAVPDTLSDIAD